MSEKFKTLDLNKVSVNDLIYLAGLIDGDGCFFISKRQISTVNGYPKYSLKLQIHCIDEPFIDELHNKFGGVKVIYRRKPPRRWLFGVEFTGDLLTQICELILPYIRLKKPNCAYRDWETLGNTIS